MQNVTEAAWYPSTDAYYAIVHTVAIHLRNTMSEIYLQVAGQHFEYLFNMFNF
jgi:hypothetical protein